MVSYIELGYSTLHPPYKRHIQLASLLHRVLHMAYTKYDSCSILEPHTYVYKLHSHLLCSHP